MSLYVPYYRPYNKHNTNIQAPGGFFFCPGCFPFDPFLYCLNPFRPSCHFTFHTTVLKTNTTQTSMPPVGFFFFACPGFFPFDPFLYCLNPFFLHVTLRSMLPSLQQTQHKHPCSRRDFFSKSVPLPGFFFCLSGVFSL
jgi:hypothetical protein